MFRQPAAMKVIHQVIALLKRIVHYRRSIASLAIRIFQTKFIGTGIGPLWMILQPLATILVFWMVFSLGFKAVGPHGSSFVAYFISAYLPWSYLTETLNSSTNTLLANRHLVKKMVFPTETLPLVEILAASFGHLVLLVITLIFLWLTGTPPSWRLAQLPYAYACLVCLALGLSWLLSAINVFHRDVGQSLAVVLNFWFWATPVVWSVDMLPLAWKPLLNFNPAYHIIEGYRSALLASTSLWDDPTQALAFWSLTISIGAMGAYVFRRLKPQFADVI